MNSRRLIWNNLTWYWKKNLLLAVGVAVSGAVITGALMVGDSVKYSLNRIVELRLGEVTHVLHAGDRYFTTGLTEKVGAELSVPASSLLLREGTAIAGGGQVRVNHIRVLGVDSDFDLLAGTADSPDPGLLSSPGGLYGSLSGDSVVISRNLSNRLGLGVGDEVLLRIEKASLVPLNAPFVSDDESVVSLRAAIKAVAGEKQLGRFNLKVSQTSPFNVFISQKRLQELMDFQNRANVMLLRAGSGQGYREIHEAIRRHFSAGDAGLITRFDQEAQQAEVTSHRVFIDNALSSQLAGIALVPEDRSIVPEDHSVAQPDSPATAEGILTYFVNSLSTPRGKTPYSFVSTLPATMLQQDEIFINRWLAEDLSAGEGDTIIMNYFVVGPLRELTVDSARFVVRSVVPMEGRYGDRGLMPDLPGLSDAGNCRDWNTGVPIDLESIRDKDEDYWDAFGGLPKAFISAGKGVELWKNRFGTYTAFRYPAAGEAGQAITSLEAGIAERISPDMLGFTLEATREKGYNAAGSGIDFSQLFGGLSFFLLAAGILLTVLLYLLNVESREDQLRTLVLLGIPVKRVRSIMLAEGLVVAVAGAIAGLFLAVLYNRLVFSALNGIWSDVVRTDMMYVNIRPATLFTGWLVALFIAFLAMAIPLNGKLNKVFSAYMRPGRRRREEGTRFRKATLVTWVAALAIALGLISTQLLSGEVVSIRVFFPAGGLLLIAAVTLFLWVLAGKQQPAAKGLDMALLGWKNATRNRTRSLSIVLLFAIGAFLVISTGSNRKDLFVNAGDPSGGTGGFLYFAESTVPLLRQLNDPGIRNEFGLEGSYSFVQMRQADGDDASCLNLNKIINPRVLGVDPVSLRGRFSFVTRTPLLDETDPWGTLDMELPGGLIPAIADEAVIKWGLGLQVGDTLHYTNSGGGTMDLLLVGGLAPSIFQGNVLISGKHFLRQFPESSGTHVFLVEGEPADTAVISSELGRGMRDQGWDMQLASVKLAEFNSVTNAYLSIFMVMGALGLLLGTFGLVVVLSRSIMERSREIALLKAVGYSHRKIRGLVTREYMVLLLAGAVSGFATAIIATLPSVLSAHTGTSIISVLLWLGVLLINGWIWIRLVTWIALKDPNIYRGLRNE